MLEPLQPKSFMVELLEQDSPETRAMPILKEEDFEIV